MLAEVVVCLCMRKVVSGFLAFFFVHFLSHGIDHQVVGDGAAWCEEKVKIKYVHSGELSRQGV